MSILQDISKRLLAVANLPPEQRNDALMKVLMYIETVQYDMVLEQKNLIMSVIDDLIAENDAEQIAKSKLVFVPEVEEQIAPTKKTRAKKVVPPVVEEISDDLPDTIEPFEKIRNLPEPIRKLIGLRRKEQGFNTDIDLDGFISSVINVNNTPESVTFWDSIIMSGNLKDFKKIFGNKGEKVDDLIEFSELNEFVEGLSQTPETVAETQAPVVAESLADLPDFIDKETTILELPNQITYLAIFRNEQENDSAIDSKDTLQSAFVWNNTPEGDSFWSKINDLGDLREFKRIYGNKGESVDNVINGLVGFNELLEFANKQNAPVVASTTTPVAPKPVPAPKPVKVITPKPVQAPKVVKVITPKPIPAPKVVKPKPIKVVTPKATKQKTTKPKVEDDLSFLDDLDNIF
jgi:hypothetical protein